MYEPGGPSDVDEDDDVPKELDVPHQQRETPNPQIFQPCQFSQSSVQIDFQNYPAVCETYKDPDTRIMKVLVAVNLPGGARHVKFEVNEDGYSMTLKFNWSKTWCNMEDLFKAALDDKEISLHHAKVDAMKSALEKCRPRIDASRETVITVKLPIQVQTTPGTYSRIGIVRDDGLLVFMAEFCGYVKEFNKKFSDADVIFDK